jgi:hypothetical protein
MSDNTIEKILIDLLEEGLGMGDRGLRVKVESYVKNPAQQIRQYIDTEIIGKNGMEIEYGLVGSKLAERLRNRNELRAEQRQKLK